MITVVAVVIPLTTKIMSKMNEVVAIGESNGTKSTTAERLGGGRRRVAKTIVGWS